MNNLTLHERFHLSYKRHPSGCWLWFKAIVTNGYGQIRNGAGKRPPAHRVSWEIYRGAIPDGLWVLHKCDVRNCVNPDHLFLGTHQDNVDDREAKGRGNQPCGETQNQAKLTVWQARIIFRVSNNSHLSNKEISEIFGVGTLATWRIKRGITWSKAINMSRYANP